jgi:hypothetical protein
MASLARATTNPIRQYEAAVWRHRLARDFGVTSSLELADPRAHYEACCAFERGQPGHRDAAAAVVEAVRRMAARPSTSSPRTTAFVGLELARGRCAHGSLLGTRALEHALVEVIADELRAPRPTRPAGVSDEALARRAAERARSAHVAEEQLAHAVYDRLEPLRAHLLAL